MVLAFANECPHPPEPMITMLDTCTGDLHALKGVRLKLKIPLIH